jgi:hypothetical protein
MEPLYSPPTHYPAEPFHEFVLLDDIEIATDYMHGDRHKYTTQNTLPLPESQPNNKDYNG